MLLRKDFSYVEQKILLGYILMLEAIPYDVLRDYEIQKKVIKINSSIKNRILLRWNWHYRALAWWLKILLLEIYKPLPLNQFEAFFNVSLEAKFSIARLEWSLSIYPEMAIAHENFNSPLELWYMLELSHFIKWIELTGMTGSPAVNEKGLLLGKAEGLELDIAELNAYKRMSEKLTTTLAVAAGVESWQRR